MSRGHGIRAGARRPTLAVTLGHGGLALASVLWVVPAAAQEVVDATCRFGEASRRVQLERGESEGGLPCRVLYTKGGREQVLWRADASVGFCRGKALELIERLESAGWTCGGDASPVPRPAAAEREEPAPAAASRPATREVPDPPSAPAATPDRPRFEQALQRDLTRLNATGREPGAFTARGGVLGDLDGDGVREAATIVAYRASEPPVQFLLLYRFDGETFVAVAKTALGAPGRSGQAEVERIGEEGIQVRMLVFQADDPPCCPTGERRVLFTLDDGQLAEVSPDKLADRRAPASRPGAGGS